MVTLTCRPKPSSVAFAKHPTSASLHCSPWSGPVPGELRKHRIQRVGQELRFYRSCRRSQLHPRFNRRARHLTTDCSAAVLRPKVVLAVIGAALSRLVFLLAPAKQFARHLPKIVRQLKPSGPAGVVLLVLGIFGAGVARLRQKIVTNVRSCKCCYGYGIRRCSLCSGRGMVGWEGKWSHREPCPMCLGRRFSDCEACGGRFHRPLFQHTQTTASTLLSEIKEAEAKLGGVVLAD